MPNNRPTLEDIRIVWQDVGVPAYALPKKDWFDRLDAVIRADERLLVSAEKDAEIARLTDERDRWLRCAEQADRELAASRAKPEASVSPSLGARAADTERLDWLLRKAMLCGTEDGEKLGLFLCLWGDDERELAIAIAAESSDNEEGTFTPEDVPFLTEAQRKHLNEHGCTDDRAAILAALDKVRAARSPALPLETTDG